MKLTSVHPAGIISCSSVHSLHVQRSTCSCLISATTLQDWKLETRKLTPSNLASSLSLVAVEAVMPYFFPLPPSAGR